MTSLNGIKPSCDIIANFSLIFLGIFIGIFDGYKFFKLRNSENLFLFNNTKIPKLCNSGI